MTPSILRRLSILVLLGSLGMACACQAEPAETRLLGEIDRLEKALAGRGDPQADSLREQLAAARQASAPAVRAYRLRDPFVGLETLAFVREHPAAGKDLGPLEALWKERGKRFAARPASEALQAPPLLTALTQAAENRAEKLYRAALPYGRVDSPASGLHYLAEAEALMSFRDFISALDLPAEDETTLNPKALQAALERIEAETLQGFAADPVAPTMVGVSAHLKEARELFERGSLEGAALELLESRLELDRRHGAGAPAATGAQKAAEGSLLAPFAGASVSDLAPLYQSFFTGAPHAAAASTVTVTLTLIRWPYT